jgi:large subunit ribosomal protein L43
VVPVLGLTSLSPCLLFRTQRGSLSRATCCELGSKILPGADVPGTGSPGLVPPPLFPARVLGRQAVAMTARGTPSRFLTSVLHNGLGRYVQQLQRLSFSLSRDASSSRGAR